MYELAKIAKCLATTKINFLIILEVNSFSCMDISQAYYSRHMGNRHKYDQPLKLET